VVDQLQRLLNNLKHAEALIDAGYRSLAKAAHPDQGGSIEAMARLNRVREHLRNAVASHYFWIGFEAAVERRRRREKTPELSELRELKRRLRAAV
jgi:hypothetical protein